MSRARIYFRNILANWFGFGANLVAVFFLTPYVVHNLGESTYGVWSIVMSLTGYMGLAELGTRVGLGRFINYYMGRDEPDNVNGAINTALIVFTVCGAAVIVVAALLGGYFTSLFNVDARYVEPVRIALMLTALSLMMSFFGAAFNQILIAVDRFDIQNALMLGVLAIRIVGTVAVIRHVQPLAQFPYAEGLRLTGPVALTGREWAIAGLASLQLINGFASLIGAYLIARRVWPALCIGAALGSMRHFWELFGFSVWAFLGNIAIQLLTWTDTLIIGRFYGAAAVTFYSIGSMLVIYTHTLVSKSVTVIGPQLVKDCARRDFVSIRAMFGYGNTLAMFIGVPLLTGLIVFGREFLTLWMGEGYELSYRVLSILAISNYFGFFAAMSGTVYNGLNRPRLLALLMIAQGVANIGLTLIFVLRTQWGVEGVALGTLFPRMLFSLITVIIVLRWIGMPVSRHLARQIMRWLFGIGVFAAIGWTVNTIMPTDGWMGFMLKGALSLALYALLSWFLLMRHAERGYCKELIKR